jgi:small-conductance mechanosensitive channel
MRVSTSASLTVSLIGSLLSPAQAFSPHLPQRAVRSSASTQKSPLHKRDTSLYLDISLQTAAEFVFSSTLAIGMDPLVEQVYNGTHPARTDCDVTTFRQTIVHGAADSIANAARLYSFLLVTDGVLDILNAKWPLAVTPYEAALPLSIDLWLALTLSTFKRSTFKQADSKSSLGRAGLFDKILDFMIFIFGLAVAVKVLQIDIGTSVESVVGAGGAGALAVSFASKDLGQAIVKGFAMQNWDAFKVGDWVRFGDGTSGTIVSVGLVETEVMGGDNVITRIPNSELSHRISNLSQSRRSQVKQTLRFKYSDLDKLPSVLEDIKNEIAVSCPKLVLDGSKPFHAVLEKYEPDHVQAAVDCHFDIQPASSEYLENQQEVVLAINRAVKRRGLEFALPSIAYKTAEPAFLP